MSKYIQSKHSYLIANRENLNFSFAFEVFSNPPDTVFAPIYNSILNKSITTQIKELMDTSNSKIEFEKSITETARYESTRIYSSLSEIVRKCSSFYINQDGIVTAENNIVQLHIGRLNVDKYTQRKFIDDLLNVSNMIVERQKNEWLISFGFTQIGKMKDKIPNIITFSDAVHYVHREVFKEELLPIFDALKQVAKMIEQDADNRIMKVFEKLLDGIFIDN